MAEGQSTAPAGCRVDLTGQVALVTGLRAALAGRLPSDWRPVALHRWSCPHARGLNGTLQAIRETGRKRPRDMPSTSPNPKMSAGHRGD